FCAVLLLYDTPLSLLEQFLPRRHLLASTALCSPLSFSGCGNHRALHSFPTPRSSDLILQVRKSVAGRFRPPYSTIRGQPGDFRRSDRGAGRLDRKSTRLNSSHVSSSYAVFCSKRKRGKVEARGAR